MNDESTSNTHKAPDAQVDDSVLDNAIRAIKSQTPSDVVIDAAAQRVSALLNIQVDATENSGAHRLPGIKASHYAQPKPQISSIEELIDAIPDYLAGKLSASQKLLFDEECRHSLPLRFEH
jgi:hypothetical protein